MMLRLFFLLLFWQPVLSAVNTADIVAKVGKAAPQCLHYRKPVGQCIFIDINGEKNFTNEIAHYQPDMVVATYNEPGAIPWTEMRLKNEVLLKQILSRTFPGQSIGGGPLSVNAGRIAIFFKEAAVYGAPIPNLSNNFLCPRANSPGQEHFQSEQDGRAWRQGTSQTASGILPALGFILESSAEKAAAIIAQRAAFIGTGGNDNLITTPHQVSPASLSCGDGCETFVAMPDNPRTALWQPLYPNAATSCGLINSDALVNLQNTKEDHVLVVWRCYRCCEPGQGKFVGKINFLPYEGCPSN